GLITRPLASSFRWLAGGVAVIVLGLGYWLVIRPQLSSIQTISLTQRNSVRNQISGERDYHNRLQASINKFHQVIPTETLSALDDFLPSSPDFPGLLLTIQNIAANSNVRLKSMTLSQAGELATASTPGATSGGNAANAAALTSLNLKTQDISIT